MYLLIVVHGRTDGRMTFSFPVNTVKDVVGSVADLVYLSLDFGMIQGFMVDHWFES
jgi:hypothetical protein